MDPREEHATPATQLSNLVIQPCTTDDLRRQMETTLLAMDARDDYPGTYDHVQLAAAIDPHSFIGGYLNGQIISMICVCNYDDGFAFLGTFLTWPEYQRQGIGAQLFREALRHAGDRTVGLIAKHGMAYWYEKQGFKRIGTDSGYELSIPRQSAVSTTQANASIVPVRDVDFDELCRFDRKYFPADRRTFLHKWLTHSKVTSLAYTKDGAIRGYGAIRQCTGDKICKFGPLFADSPEIAEELAEALLTAVPEGIEKVEYECYNDNQHAGMPAIKLGFHLAEDDGDVVMYKNGLPNFDVSGVYAYTNGAFG